MGAPELSELSVVIVGAWNQAIFSPEWLHANVWPNGEPIAMFVNLGAVAVSRFQVGDIGMIVAPGRLQVTAEKLDVPTFEAVEAVAATILELLRHTPVQARGINMKFVAKDGSNEVPALTFMNQYDLGAPLAATQATWSVSIGQDLFNVKLTHTADGSAVDVNVHRDTPTAAATIESLRGLPKSLERAQDLVRRFWK